MFNKLLQILHIRHGEVLITALMCLQIAGVMGFYYILKPMRSALFLKDLSAADLPKAYLLAALLAGPVVMLMSRSSRRLSVIALVTATNLGVIAGLVFFRWALPDRLPYLPYLYFAYVQIVPVLCAAQFWLMAGYIFDGRQAKRIYGLLGAGAIAGSIAGSLTTDLLRHRSVHAMLGICIGICLALAVLAHVVWRHRRQDIAPAKESSRGSGSSPGTPGTLGAVAGLRHLKLLVVLILLTTIASQIVDWQLDYAAQQSFQHLPKQSMEEEIRAFRARFNWVTNLIAIGLQLSLTSVVLQRAGIWAALLFLPFGVGAASLGVLFAPSLRSAAIALGCNSISRFSIHRAGVELLFFPLPPVIRKKVKLFIDVFVDRAGRAVAAFIIMALTTRYLPVGLSGTAAAVIALSGACILVAVRLRGSYSDALRRNLNRREVDLSEVSRYVTDPASLRLLISALESRNERQILYALGLLQSSRGYDFSARLLPLLRHNSPLVREEAARTLHALPGNYESEAERLLEDASDGVRDAAVAYLCLREPARADERIHRLLGHSNPEVRLSAARCAAAQPERVFHPSMNLIRDLMAPGGMSPAKACAAAAFLASKLPREDCVPFLRGLLRDSRPQVSAAAIWAAGQAGCAELASDLVALLSDRRLRPASRQALVSMGPKVIDTLAQALRDEKMDFAARYEIPWILSQFQDAQAAGILVQNLNAEDFRLRYQIVKALSRMRASNPRLPGRRLLVEVHLFAHIMAYYEGLAMLQALEDSGTRSNGHLVSRALKERLEAQFELIFRLLGLVYPQQDIYFAYMALKGADKAKRLSAIDFLDNTLARDVRTLVLPLLEDEPPARLLARARRSFNLRVPGRGDALLSLLRQPEPWLKACALHAIGSGRMAHLESFCRQLLPDPDPRVREMAEWALARVPSSTKEDMLYADQS